MVTLDCREKSAAVSWDDGVLLLFSVVTGGWGVAIVVVDADASGVLPPKPKTRLASAAGEKKPAVRDVLRGSGGGSTGLDAVDEEASSTKAGRLRPLRVVDMLELEDQDRIVAGVAAAAEEDWCLAA